MGKAGDPRTGRRWLAFSRRLLDLPGWDRCWLCSRVRCLKGCCPRANSVDHVVPVVEAPDRCYDLDNVQPAHRCCNFARGSRPAPRQVSSRTW